MSRFTDRQLKSILSSPQKLTETLDKLTGNIIDNVEKIGQLWHEGRAKYGDVKMLASIIPLRAKFPQRFFLNCERAAMGSLDPRLVMAFGKAVARISKYAANIQKTILDNGVELVMPDGNVIMAPVDGLSHDQADQALDYDAPRGVDAQQDWLQSRAERTQENTPREAKQERDKPDWEIRKGELLVHKEGTTFNRKQLFEILAELVD